MFICICMCMLNHVNQCFPLVIWFEVASLASLLHIVLISVDLQLVQVYHLLLLPLLLFMLLLLLLLFLLLLLLVGIEFSCNRFVRRTISFCQLCLFFCFIFIRGIWLFVLWLAVVVIVCVCVCVWNANLCMAVCVCWCISLIALFGVFQPFAARISPLLA